MVHSLDFIRMIPFTKESPERPLRSSGEEWRPISARFLSNSFEKIRIGKAYRYRLYSTNAQETMLVKTLEALNIDNLLKNPHLAKTSRRSHGESCAEPPVPGSMGWLEDAARRSQVHLATLFEMWVTGKKKAGSANPAPPPLRVGDGLGPECRDQYIEIGAAIPGTPFPRIPPCFSRGSNHVKDISH